MRAEAPPTSLRASRSPCSCGSRGPQSAVAVGFEPTVESPPHMFSRHAPSAARTRHRGRVYGTAAPSSFCAVCRCAGRMQVRMAGSDLHIAPEPAHGTAARATGPCRCSHVPSIHGHRTHEADSAGLPLHGVRLAHGEVGRPLRRVPELGLGRGGGCRRSARVQPAQVPASAGRSRSSRCRSMRCGAAARASASSIACSAAGWCPAPWCCCPASPASARAPCCSPSPPTSPRSAPACSTSARRSRPGRCASGPSAPARMQPTLLLSAETDLAVVLGQIEQESPDLVIVDSVQTVSSAETTGFAGGPGQVREVAASLTRVAKERDLPDPARRPRHEGRPDRRPPGARAPRRRRLPVRGRPAHRPPLHPRRQEPLRPDGRGRLLRDDRRRHRRGARPERPLPLPQRRRGAGHLRHHRAWRVAARCRSRCRPSSSAPRRRSPAAS